MNYVESARAYAISEDVLIGDVGGIVVHEDTTRVIVELPHIRSGGIVEAVWDKPRDKWVALLVTLELKLC